MPLICFTWGMMEQSMLVALPYGREASKRGKKKIFESNLDLKGSKHESFR